MKSTFDKVSTDICQLTTRTYSTSFSWGIYFLDDRLRSHIYAIYGFVRLADEIVDSFDGFDQNSLLNELKKDTYQAIEQRISCNPILNAFQHTVWEYNLDHQLIESFFNSMEMDLDKSFYSTYEYQDYIFGSAEVVGLMCLHVFTEGNIEKYNELKPYAMKLGSAFQKVNFLRDIQHDHNVLGRMYFPDVEWSAFNRETKSEIENDIETDFKIALKGIKMLPVSSRAGVYLAYVYYRSLFNKIRKMKSSDILKKRIRISNGRKFGLMVNSVIQFKMNLL